MENALRKSKFIIAIFAILLAGCGQKDSTSTNSAEAPELVSEGTDVLVNEKADNEVVLSQENTNDTPISTFNISAVDIAKTIYGKSVDSYSKNINEYHVDVFPDENYFVFCVSSVEENFPMLVYTYDQSKSGTRESSDNLIKPFLDSLSDTQNIKVGACNTDDSSRDVISYAYIIDSDITNFTPTVQISSDTDYFLHADTEEYKLACTEGRYNDIFHDVQSYIDECNPPTYDSAYTIQSILSPIINDWESIKVEYDSIENHATFYYSNVENINNDIHFVPYALTNERNIRSLIGFYDSDWLFFDSIIISSDDNIRISASKNKIEDVVNGGRVYEAYIYAIDDDDLNQLLSSPDHTIRFKGKNDDYIDYAMTDKEYEALVAISKFQNVRNILSDLLFHFQKRQPESK
ncbi:MAG: hypothetical protein HDR71_12170 [Lachnospiraceae bacterium]|nr:hypothetical protein [Lachnospiraceae bacterium]